MVNSLQFDMKVILFYQKYFLIFIIYSYEGTWCKSTQGTRWDISYLFEFGRKTQYTQSELKKYNICGNCDASSHKGSDREEGGARNKGGREKGGK